MPLPFNLNCEVGEICNAAEPCSDASTCLQRPDLPNRICQGTCTAASCSCTWPQYYWSRTSDLSSAPATSAWRVDFSNGSIGNDDKMSRGAVRAVRGQATPHPTPTPAPNDCCQCPSSCAAPVDGSCGTCTVVFAMACDGGQLCGPPPPTLTPTPCLADNGDGTVSDACRGLRWEKKDRAGGLHDYGTLYTWAGTCTGESRLCQPNAEAAATCAQQTGGDEGCGLCTSGTCVVDPDHNGAATTIWDWLNQLNASTFAGFNDWRIPTAGFEGDTAELETLCTAGGSVPMAFNTNCTAGCTVESCSCTQFTLQDYWTATTIAFQPGLADGVSFVFCGSVGAGPKTNANSVRAVRSGP